MEIHVIEKGRKDFREEKFRPKKIFGMLVVVV